MDATAPLELRIHSGDHAGASEALYGQNYVLGADPACDFVLGDSGLLPQQVRLEFGDGHWRMLQCSDATEESPDAVDLVTGVLHRIGPVVISIDSAHAPWPQTVEISALLSQPRPEVELAEVEVPRTIEEMAAPILQAQEELAAVVAPEHELKPARPLSRALIASLLAVIVGALLWLLLPKNALENANPQAKAPVAYSSALASGSVSAIEAVILAQGLGGRVTAESEAPDKFRVRAALLTDDEYEKLAMALSALRPRPALAVTTEQDLQIMVAEALARHSGELGTYLTATHRGGANFRVEGTMSDALARSTLLDRLRNELPTLVVLESALLTPEDLSESMLEDLRKANFAEIKGHWTDRRLQMSISLSQEEVPNWENQLARVARKYKLPFSVNLALQEKAVSKTPPKSLTLLPFKLQSVVSGETPYVVIDGGIKVLLDGRTQGWRLVSVNPASVEFEGEHAKRVVVER